MRSATMIIYYEGKKKYRNRDEDFYYGTSKITLNRLIKRIEEGKITSFSLPSEHACPPSIEDLDCIAKIEWNYQVVYDRKGL